ncbi:MAG: Gfo/Idh/MocA family oxidoreductase [Gammaproteobacteria bacterium]|nr:Gfo/Idh/MocA family oxidoreductase [Gammaproteobacteria bacterium]
MRKLRAAVIGVGYLGAFHVQKYLALPHVDVVAVVDTDSARVGEVGAKYGVHACTDYGPLLAGLDIVSIVTPPATHFEIARRCLGAGVHTLVEKPVTETVAQAEALIELANARGLVFQVGHLERFNPAVLALRPLLTRPTRIEARRLSVYKQRGTDVDVVLDMMIHDIDIALSLVDSPVVGIEATGSVVVSGDIDRAQATLHFADGCVAELAASRVNLEAVRAMTVQQADSYITVDFANHALLVGSVEAGGRLGAPRDATVETLHFERSDALMDEIRSFVDAVGEGRTPTVSGEDGKRALAVAVAVSQTIHRAIATRTPPRVERG